MKKVLCLLMVLTMALGCISISASAAEYGIVLNNNVAILVGSTTAVANNSLQTLQAAPVAQGDDVLVPLSAVSVLLNGMVNYDAATGIINISFGADTQVVLRTGSTQYTLNGRGYDLAVAPRVENGVVMVPVIGLARDAIGFEVFYDRTTQLVVISSRRVIKDSVSDAAVISTIANAIRTGVLPPISVPTSYELDWTVTTASGSNASNDPGQLKFVNISASAEPEAQNPAANVNDGSAATFWAIGDVGGQLIGDIGKLNNMTEIKVAFAKYTERAANYALYVSEDNKNYELIFSGSSAQGQQWDSHSVTGAYRYVKLISNGNSAGSTWNSVAEIQVFNGDSGSGSSSEPIGTPISSSTFSYKASAEPEPENNAGNAFDGNSSTFWAVEGDNDLVIDLGSSKRVEAVSVQMRSYDDGRAINYTLGCGSDGSNYDTIYDGISQFGGGVPENHIVGTDVRYIRLGVSGSSTNAWASVAEIIVYGEYVPTTGGSASSGVVSQGAAINPASYSASAEPESNNPGASAIDGNADTFWAADGSQNLVLDLGSAQDVGSVSVQMRKYTDNPGRTVNYSVEYSADGSNYTSVFNGAAAAGGGAVETHAVGAQARYIRVGVNGSNEGSWASLAEVVVYGTGSSGGAGYKNMSSISGEFMLAVAGTTNVLSVGGDGTTLTVGSDQQKWAAEGSALRNVSTGKYMDVFNQSYDVGGQIGVWDGNGGTNQQWEFNAVEGGYLIKNVMSGLYLSAVGANIQQLDSGSATKWVVTDGTMDDAAGGSAGTVVSGVPDIDTFGEFVLTNSDGDILSLASDGEGVVAGPYQGLSTQKWTQSDGIVTNSGTGARLSVAGNSARVGIMICVSATGTTSQRWTFEKVSNGYIIKNENSGLYISIQDSIAIQRARANATVWTAMEVGSSGEVNIPVESVYENLDSVSGNFLMVPIGGNNVVGVGPDDYALSAGAYNGDARQQWTLEGNGIKNVALGTYLDVSGESMDPGAQIGVWEGNGGANQRWSLERDGNGYYVRSTFSGLYLGMANGGQQVSRESATKFIIASTELPGAGAIQQTVPTVPTATGYSNMDNISGSFMIAVYGTTDVLSVNSDNFSLSVGASGARSMWSLDGAAVKNNSAGVYLDVSDQSMDEGGAIIVWEGNGGTNQQWTFEKDGDGYYIKSVMSGLYLAVVNGGAQQVSRASATKWVVTDGSTASAGTTAPTVTGVTSLTSKYTNMTSISGDFIIAELGTDNVLTVGDNNQSLSVASYSQNGKQQWTLEGASFKNIGSGNYLDVSGQSMDVGGEIIVWESTGGDNQMWVFEKDGDSAYYIKSLMSGLYLSVVNGGVQQVAKGSASRWVIAAK